MKYNKGVTLITLIISIIVIIILSAVMISVIMSENGILNTATLASKKSEEAQERETLNLVLQEALIEKTQSITYNSYEFLDDFIYSKIPDVLVNGNYIKVEKYTFIIDRQKLLIVDSLGKDIDPNFINNDSLIGNVANIQESGYTQITVNGKVQDGTLETNSYSIHTLVYNGDLTLDGVTNVEGAILANSVYEFGDSLVDVATESTDAQNMVILKINGNLNINSGVTLTSCKSQNGFGGSKGFMIYCTGTINNNGIISMTGRGAKAVGENLYLWKNVDDSFEYVPAVGAIGGDAVLAKSTGASVWVYKNGINGVNAILNSRQTGGGGAGAAAAYATASVTSGGGSTGTSYSGRYRWRIRSC